MLVLISLPFIFDTDFFQSVHLQISVNANVYVSKYPTI